VATSPAAVTAATQGNCTTIDEKMDALEVFILENYGRTARSYLEIYSIEEERLFETYFYPKGLSCEGKVTVDKDCQIGNAEGTILANAALREQTIRCELDTEE